MIPVVLLDENLSRARLKRALDEIRTLAGTNNIAIVIKSTAGDGVAAVDFTEEVHKLGLKLRVKIYEASSAAAYIALALGDDREMRADSTLSIHRGEIHLSPSEISPDNKVNEGLVKSFRRYDIALTTAINAVGLHGRKDELYATDWLRLSADECLKLGIVKRLF